MIQNLHHIAYSVTQSANPEVVPPVELQTTRNPSDINYQSYGLKKPVNLVWKLTLDLNGTMIPEWRQPLTVLKHYVLPHEFGIIINRPAKSFSNICIW